MKGKLAGIFKGITQIGGLIDWELDTNLVNLGGESYTYKLASWKVKAQGYWFFDIPNVLLIVRLYPDIGKGYWEGQGRVNSEYQKLLNTLIHGNIEILGNDALEGKV